jgi:hypothetical protein
MKVVMQSPGLQLQKAPTQKKKSGHDRKERKEKALLPMPIVV